MIPLCLRVSNAPASDVKVNLQRRFLEMHSCKVISVLHNMQLRTQGRHHGAGCVMADTPRTVTHIIKLVCQ